jgi:hypothetical protein
MKDMAATRRKVLEYFFVHIYEAPEQNVWLWDGVVSSISHQLQISQGSSTEVKKVFLDILAARAAQKKYDEHAGAKLRGRKLTIVDCTPQAEVVYSTLAADLSTTQATFILNQAPVSWLAVNAFVGRSNVVFH